MSERLYVKEVSEKGKVTYRPYEPRRRVEFALTDAQIVTLASSIGYCALMGLERHMPEKSAVRGRIAKVEDAIKSLAQLNSCKLDEDMLKAGTKAWGAAMLCLQDELTKEV